MKLIISEQGSDEMISFAESIDDSLKVVSILARIEAASTISRLRKGRRLLADEASLAFESSSFAINQMTVELTTPDVLDRAAAIAEHRCLRALDAIQLASAVIARNLLSQEEMRFIASDKELLEAAQKEGFTIWNPCD